MSGYTLHDVAEIVGGKCFGKDIRTIDRICIDSRTIVQHETTLFFALTGLNHNGHHYISELVQKKIRNFVISNKAFINPSAKDTCFILVEDSLQALQKLAAYHRGRFSVPVLAITGSNGKTIVKEWLFTILKDKKKVVRSPKSYNSQVGVPLSVWELESTDDLAIFEAGISKRGEMEKLEAILKPDIGLLTNIGEAHQENFESLREKANEKIKLFANCSTIVYCKDQPIIAETIEKLAGENRINLFSWSGKAPADLTIHNIEQKEIGTEIVATYSDRKVSISLLMKDDASVENAIHCMAVLLVLNIPLEEIVEGIAGLQPIAMRLEIMEGIHNCTLINDSYNSDTTSLQIALDLMNHHERKDKKTIILSDILQSGKSETRLYADVARKIRENNVMRVIGVGPGISRHLKPYFVNGIFFNNSEDLLKIINDLVFSNEIILIKGARDYSFERITKALQKKKHRTVLEIDFNALVHNLNYFRSLLEPKTKIMVMVKALSYGSGLLEIASLLQFHRVDYLAVAYIDEGVELRNAGITVPILVMNSEPNGFSDLIENNLEPVIYDFRVLELFSELLVNKSITTYPIHLELDSGMKRLGFSIADLQELKTRFSQPTPLHIQSIFSHLVGSENSCLDHFTQEQFNIFDAFYSELCTIINYVPLAHVLNSAGIQRFPDKQYDMVRLGIGLYGVGDNTGNRLQNVSTFKTIISQIKAVGKGETVGYSRSGSVERDTKIAVLPVGYADGLSRHLGNRKGKVLINSCFAPIVGNICMDMCMVDITDISAKEGDDVILFGKDLPVTYVADAIGTIAYEVLTNVSGRVNRVYYKE